MVLQSSTPYVTPHILHKHYAQAFDHDPYSNREFIPELSFQGARNVAMTNTSFGALTVRFYAWYRASSVSEHVLPGGPSPQALASLSLENSALGLVPRQCADHSTDNANFQ